ncbi:hypothetical protein GCM10023187_28690 [Nibrella viscosa]|uniref:Secretion system C-terminal sorting domain-containing protein n=1 Tax=Nibrella viscosa TaxID=1084524 RepID=A0ABP8KJB8_9BACT
MKRTNTTLLRFALALLLTGSISGLAVAQQAKEKAKNDQLRVRIIERNGNRVSEVDRTYPLDGMTDEKRDALVKRLVDSVQTARKEKGNSQLTIIIEEGNNELRIKSRRPEAYALRPNRSLPKNDRRLYFYNDGNGQFDFRMNFDSLANRLNRRELNLPRNFEYRLAEPFENWSRNGSFGTKASTVRSLDAYPNNPDQNLLNVRFVAPAKGDITITITNPKGKEVARKEVKDFSGEYVGQIDLGKNAKGTYFITVTQNEDGAVKRIVIP